MDRQAAIRLCRVMRVLCACEESQEVCKSFRRLGIEAYSCDTQPCSGGYPEWHVQADVKTLLRHGGWDLIVAFPPCTHLTNACANTWPQKQADGRQKKAIEFFLQFFSAGCRHVAVENPRGIIGTVWRKPDQTVQPYQFGDPYQKRTCLWLRNLPLLRPTKQVSRGDFINYPSGPRPAWYNLLGKLPASERSKRRSRTFTGIADAMAVQWSAAVKEGYSDPEQLCLPGI